MGNILRAGNNIDLATQAELNQQVATQAGIDSLQNSRLNNSVLLSEDNTFTGQLQAPFQQVENEDSLLTKATADLIYVPVISGQADISNGQVSNIDISLDFLEVSQRVSLEASITYYDSTSQSRCENTLFLIYTRNSTSFLETALARDTVRTAGGTDQGATYTFSRPDTNTLRITATPDGNGSGDVVVKLRILS